MKQLKYKVLISLVAILLMLQPTHAQSVARISYFMENAPHSHLLNPALAPTRGYITYPAIGSTVFELQSNLGFTSFFFPNPNGGPLLTFMHPDVTSDQFLSMLKDNNYIRLNNRLSLLGAGFYLGNSFWNFEIATRAYSRMDIPKPFFEFFKKGMTAEDGDVYDIRNLDFSAGMLGEVSLGSSFEVIDRLRVGAKGKLLLGGARARVGIDRLFIDMREYKWAVESDAVIDIHASGIEMIPDADNTVDSLSFTKFGLAGAGAAIDLGASYALITSPSLSVNVSLGILDLGAVGWNKNSNQIARAKGKLEYTGVEEFNLEGMEEGEDPFAALQEQMISMTKPVISDDQEKFVEGLPPMLNIGAEAGILNDKISFGLLFSNRFIPRSNIAEITGMVTFKPISMFNLSTSYTVLNGMGQSIGLGLGLNLYVANIFLACDYIPLRYNPQGIPLTKANTSIQLGLSVGLGRKKPKPPYRPFVFAQADGGKVEVKRADIVGVEEVTEVTEVTEVKEVIENDEVDGIGEVIEVREAIEEGEEVKEVMEVISEEIEVKEEPESAEPVQVSVPVQSE